MSKDARCYCHMLRSDEGICHVCEDYDRAIADSRDENRQETIAEAVRAAVAALWPTTLKQWGSVGNGLQALGYDGRTDTWIGLMLHREVLNRFRQLNAGR